MMEAGRGPMTYPELKMSRTLKARKAGEAFAPKLTPDQIRAKQSSANTYDATYDRIIASNPEHSRPAAGKPSRTYRSSTQPW